MIALTGFETLSGLHGRFGGVDSLDDTKMWGEMISKAERLLIYYCAPPYNSSGIGNYGSGLKDLIILNYGTKAMLPFELSTLYEDSEYAKSDDGRWKYYSRNE